jgi:hypothetical protein
MDPGRTVCAGLLVPDPKKVLASNTPTGYFQFRSATVFEISLSAKEIDATATLESFQNVQDGPRGRDLQQSAVSDLMFVKT